MSDQAAVIRILVLVILVILVTPAVGQVVEGDAALSPRAQVKAAATKEEQQASGSRRWTDGTGRFSVEASLVDVKEGAVRLRKTDGTIIQVPLAKLSLADSKFLETLSKEEPKKKTSSPEPESADRFAMTVQWTRDVTVPVAISELPDIQFKSRDGQPIKQVFYAFEANINKGSEMVTEKHSADKPIPLGKAEGVIPMADGPMLPPNVIPPASVIDLVLKVARGLTGSGTIRIAFFADSRCTKPLSEWLTVQVDLSK